MKKTLFLIILLIVFNQCYSQHNKSWYSGRTRIYNGFGKFEPFNPPQVVKFTQDSISVKYKIEPSIKAYLSDYHFTMCDSFGNIEFFTNGLRIYNKKGAVMENGDSINLKINSNNVLPSGTREDYWNLVDTSAGAFTGPYGSIGIPYPGNANRYLLYYSCFYRDSSDMEHVIISYADIDMKYNNGLGKVISKENELIRGINLGNPTILRHGNGRDWWLLTYSNTNNYFYLFLIDPTGIKLWNTILSGPIINGFSSYYRNKFSSDGKLFVKIDQCDNISIYSFNRCEGTMDYLKTVNIVISNGNCTTNPNITCGDINPCTRGIEFSSDNKLLYIINHYYEIFQLDLNSFQVQRIFSSPAGETRLEYCHLLADKKIYIDNPLFNSKYHVIRRPDLKGLASDVDYNSMSVDNENVYYKFQESPNYLLNNMKSTVCDSL